mmetsp:Transcript_15119/g.25888  ORF Transcript_15119/g.25888 Transcript_15119/m.25888 type:complete len:206 (+) Transcript_15119:255-872(+)
MAVAIFRIAFKNSRERYGFPLKRLHKRMVTANLHRHFRNCGLQPDAAAKVGREEVLVFLLKFGTLPVFNRDVPTTVLRPTSAWEEFVLVTAIAHRIVKSNFLPGLNISHSNQQSRIVTESCVRVARVVHVISTFPMTIENRNLKEVIIDLQQVVLVFNGQVLYSITRNYPPGPVNQMFSGLNGGDGKTTGTRLRRILHVHIRRDP